MNRTAFNVQFHELARGAHLVLLLGGIGTCEHLTNATHLLYSRCIFLLIRSKKHSCKY
jgi:hypothetical protein